ncbi:unnamed protein product [Clonostachys rosea]|uniref:NACHT domain-containing protein n=1 Tax=Bionectria ochroleuca TaxID=29856 RepID=A0ABY6V3I0_BIOOC|nr:unnamed protein product [Clonostachys rosea]
MTYGYVPAPEKSFQGNILSISNNLLSTLESDRREVLGRPLIFIAHSLGGIIVKKALDLFQRSPAPLQNVTKGIIFFGTPHDKPRGGSWGELLEKIAKDFAATNTTLLTTLDSQHNENELEYIKDTFDNLLDRPNGQRLSVVTFTGSAVSGLAGSISKPAFPIECARISSPWTKVRTLQGSHETMCEFGSRTDFNYRQLKAELRDLEFLAEGGLFPHLLTCPYWERRDDPNPTRAEGTFEWLLSHTVYNYWRESDFDNVLWVTSDPGYGKSVLARHVAENVLPSTSRRLTCYFFFNHGYSDQDSVTEALFCILHQVFNQFPMGVLPEALLSLVENNERTLELFDNLWSILLAVADLHHFEEVLCILDALDEASEPGRGQFINALAKLYPKLTIQPVRLKFLVTSRPHLDTSPLGTQRVNLHLSGESDGEMDMITDIIFAIQKQAGRLVQKHGLGPEDGDFLIAELCRNPNPTHLWVHLAIEVANNILLSHKNIRSKIQGFPRTVDGVYEDMLAQSRDPESTRRVLHLILAAQRPLKLREMSFALAIGPNHKRTDDINFNRETKVCEEIQDLCGAFVKIVNSRIYLVHQTAREFLVSSHESILAEICLWRITLSDYSLDQHQGDLEDVKRCRFMSYAAQHWTEHFRKGDGMHKPSTVEMAMNCATAHPLASRAWFRLHQTAGNLYIGPDKPTAVMLAAYFGLGTVMERLPQDAFDKVNEKSGGLTSLQWAVRRGHRGAVQQLIAAGADVNLKAEEGRAALHFAAERDDTVLVQQLVAAGAGINSRDGLGRTILHLAASRGFHDMVQKLLTIRVALGSQDSHGKTPLLLAIDSGHSVIVELLVASGSNVNIHDAMGQTALQRAAKRGDIDMR